MSPTTCESSLPYVTSADDSAAAQIFLRSNALLTRPLEQKDIKKRLLGHWVCPHLLTTKQCLQTGNMPWIELCLRTHQSVDFEIRVTRRLPSIRLPYRCKLNPPVSRRKADLQPGHGAPALLATLFMEGSITRFYPEYSMSADGIEAFVHAFSMPGGFPSHVNAEVSLRDLCSADSRLQVLSMKVENSVTALLLHTVVSWTSLI